jgi:hypothetical protein
MAKKPGLDNGVIASLGKQLTNKVDNGVAHGGQATKVKDQRSARQKPSGLNWRVKVYGKGGAKGRRYPTYGYKGPAKLNDVRSKALERAKTKLATGHRTPTTLKNGGTEAERKKRSNGGTTAP